MANDWGNDDPVVATPAQNWGEGDAVVGGWGAEDTVVAEVSPYSIEGLADSAQSLVQAQARLRQLREEADAEAARTKVFVGVNAPFSDRRLATFEVPEEIAAFGSEAIKSSPSVAAGAAAASAAMPLANRIGMIPGPIGTVGRLATPVIAGGAAALGERLAQDQLLPQILPDSVEQLYRDTAQIAAENPTSAMLGQFAGAAPFFRPGLPIGTTGKARVAVPAIAGAIGTGIEGAQQIAEGELDTQRLAIAGLGSALLNRETGLGRRIAPNLVMPNIATDLPPAELGAVGRTMAEPVPTALLPTELEAVNQAGAVARQEQGAATNTAERYIASLESEASQRKLRALGERMMGKSPEQQLQVLDQELKLQKDTLTEAEQRAGLEMKQLLKQQIDQQKALEKAASDEQKAIKDAEKAAQDQQAALAEANKPPEIPKSAQILAEGQKPPSIANVATEIGTQTSPYALQGKLNELSGPVAPSGQIAEAAPAPIQIGGAPAAKGQAPATFAGVQEGVGDIPSFNLYNLTEDIPGHNKGSTVSQKTLEEAGFVVPPAETAAVAPEPVAPRTREQALNDAGAELPPLSGMSRQAKRAELDAAGITRYNGKPLDDINPAELSNAVGKLRRGESLDLPKNDIIDTLQSKKRLPKRPKGEVASAGPDLIFDAAHDAAIDAAILGIRAGRALNEVVQMAVARFRQMHPRATDEQVARLAQDIEVAHGYGDPTPGRTEAEQIVADAPVVAPASGRSPEATQSASRMRQTRGAVNPNVVAPLGGATAGGTIGFAATERDPGESEASFQSRRLLNTAMGFGIGGAGGASINSLAAGARASRASKRAASGGKVPLPEVGPNQGIRRTAEKVIENRSYPEPMRRVLAEDPEIVYEKISRNRIRDMTKGATDAELAEMLSSPDQNLRIGALIQQANRAAVTPGMEEEGARLIREVSKNFTSPAQLLGMGNLVESPAAMVQAVQDTLNLNVTDKAKLKTMSDAVKKRLFELATRDIKAEQRHAKAERAAREDFGPATVKELEDAKAELGTAKKVLARYTADILPESVGQITSKIIKGNLLAPLSFAKNMFGNGAWQAALRGSESIATALDFSLSKVDGKPRTMMLGNPVPSIDELRALGSATKIAAREMLTGPSEESYIKTEVQRGFHPIRAMVQVFSGLPIAERQMDKFGIASLPRSESTGKVAPSDRIKKLIESTLGITPEISFRMLNLGDKPVRLVSEARLLNEQANLRGLKGADRQKFMALPDEATKAMIENEGRSGIMAQKNPLARKVGQIFDSWMVDIAESLGMGEIPALKEFNKITGTLQLPYREFPANFAANALNFAMPPIAAARAFVQAQRGNRRESLRNLGEMTMGFMFYAAAAYLWEKGLISPPLDPKDKKRRAAQYEMGASRINISGLERLKNGEDPKYRRGDLTREWTSIGPPAAALYVYTRGQAAEANKAARTGEEPKLHPLTGAMLDAAGAANFSFDQSFLAGTSAFIDALQDWDTFGDRFMQNTFRAITAIPLPNTLESYAKTQYKFIPELKGDSLTQTLENIWDYKRMELPQDARANLKRDMWGEAIQRTPDGKNPYFHQFLDVTKAEALAPNSLKQALLEVYQQTSSTDVYPALVTDKLAVNGVSVELDAKDYDDLQQLVGSFRKEYAQEVVSNPLFSDPNTIPEQKMLALQEAYSEGAKAGKALFLENPETKVKYPELFDLPSVPGESRLISRDLKARGRLRMAQETTP